MKKVICYLSDGLVTTLFIGGYFNELKLNINPNQYDLSTHYNDYYSRFLPHTATKAYFIHFSQLNIYLTFSMLGSEFLMRNICPFAIFFIEMIPLYVNGKSQELQRFSFLFLNMLNNKRTDKKARKIQDLFIIGPLEV